MAKKPLGTSAEVHHERWTRSGRVEGNKKGQMPWSRSKLRTFGLLGFLILAALSMIFGGRHIEHDLMEAAPDMLTEAGIDPSGLTFDAHYRDITVGGVLPAGVTAEQIEQVLDEGRGSNDTEHEPYANEDIRDVDVVAVEGAPVELGDFEVAATAAGGALVLNGVVPSAEHKDTLINAALEAGYSADQIDDQITVSGLDPSGDASGQAAKLAGVIGTLGAGSILGADLNIGNSGAVTGTIDAIDADNEARIAGAVGNDISVSSPPPPTPLGTVDVTADTNGETIVLNGDVLSEEQADTLREAAASAVGAENVVDNLNVLGLDGEVEGSDARVGALATVLGTFNQLESGDAHLTSTDLTVNGVASDEAGAEVVRGQVDGATNAGLRIGGEIKVAEPVEEPETDLTAEIDLLQEELDSLQDEIRENVVFATDSDALTDAAKGTLDKVAAAMQRYQRPVVQTGGHTDNVGEDWYNIELSQRRANSVDAYLVEQGVDQARLEPVGFGPDQPIADNTTEEGRLQNRRVEFTARESF